MMQTAYLRKPSGLEAFFIDLDECGCNMTFHFYLKLDRQPALSDLNSALREVLEAHSGINLVFKNEAWYKADTIPECTIKHIECDDICSYKPTRLDYYKQTIGLSLLHMKLKDAWYLCFDFFHGAVDGRSGVGFIYDFFKVLNGKLPDVSDFLLSDRDIVETEEKPEWNSKKHNFTVLPECEPKNWEPVKDGEEKTYVLKNNVCARSLAAKLSMAVGKCFSKKSAKMIIPVDIRRYAENNKKTLFGNLFVPVFIDANTLKKADEIREEIVDYVKHKPLLKAIAEKLCIYNKFPPKLRRAVIRFFLPIVMSSKKFIYCALVSPIGTIESEKLQSDKFNVEDVSVTFVSFPFTAFTVISVQFKGHTNTTIAWHSGRVPQKTATKLIESIGSCITE